MGGKVFEINGQVRLNISKFMVSHDKRQHVLFLFTCSEPRAQTGSASWLQFSVKVDSVGGGESHHGLAPAYLCGILGVLRFDWGWGWALGSLSCGRSSCSHRLQCFGGPRDVLGPLSEGDAISRIIPVTRSSPSLES